MMAVSTIRYGSNVYETLFLSRKALLGVSPRRATRVVIGTVSRLWSFYNPLYETPSVKYTRTELSVVAYVTPSVTTVKVCRFSRTCIPFSTEIFALTFHIFVLHSDTPRMIEITSPVSKLHSKTINI